MALRVAPVAQVGRRARRETPAGTAVIVTSRMATSLRDPTNRAPLLIDHRTAAHKAQTVLVLTVGRPGMIVRRTAVRGMIVRRMAVGGMTVRRTGDLSRVDTVVVLIVGRREMTARRMAPRSREVTGAGRTVDLWAMIVGRMTGQVNAATPVVSIGGHRAMIGSPMGVVSRSARRMSGVRTAGRVTGELPQIVRPPIGPAVTSPGARSVPLPVARIVRMPVGKGIQARRPAQTGSPMTAGRPAATTVIPPLLVHLEVRVNDLGPTVRTAAGNGRLTGTARTAAGNDRLTGTARTATENDRPTGIVRTAAGNDRRTGIVRTAAESDPLTGIVLALHPDRPVTVTARPTIAVMTVLQRSGTDDRPEPRATDRPTGAPVATEIAPSTAIRARPAGRPSTGTHSARIGTSTGPGRAHVPHLVVRISAATSARDLLGRAGSHLPRIVMIDQPVGPIRIGRPRVRPGLLRIRTDGPPTEARRTEHRSVHGRTAVRTAAPEGARIPARHPGRTVKRRATSDVSPTVALECVKRRSANAGRRSPSGLTLENWTRKSAGICGA